MKKNNKEDKTTCGHYRFLVPNEEANELYHSEGIYCEVCEPFINKQFRYVQREKLLCQAVGDGQVHRDPPLSGH